MRKNTCLLGAMTLLAAAGLTAAARAADTPSSPSSADIPALADKAARSLVLVEYNFRNENVSREEGGQGIVVAKDIVLISGTILPEGLPREWVRDLKIRVPGKRFATVPATFLGRTTNRLFAYLKAEEPIDVPPLDVSRKSDLKLGQEICSVALMGKGGGYETYLGYSRVRALMHLSHKLGIVGTFGLTRANSPVYDEKTGDLVGLTFPPISETVTMTMENNSIRVQIRDDDQSSAVLPWEEVKDLFVDVPTKPFESRRPWLGVEGLTGIEEEVRIKYGIEKLSGVAVGAVIPDMPADKAGLKSRDIILTLDSKPFSESPVPEYMVSHFQAALEKLKIGQEIKLGILRDGEKKDITVKLTGNPKIGAEMPHVFNAKMGITTRDLVFGDTYSRKLAADQKGVMVALVKQGAPASLGSAPLKPNYLITKVNDQPVETQKQFEDTVKSALGSADAADNKELVLLVILPDGKTQVCRVDLSK